MSRNFYSDKDFEWKEHDGGLLACYDGGDVLFTVFTDGRNEGLVNAFMQGHSKGKRAGRAELQHELRKLVGAAPLEPLE